MALVRMMGRALRAIYHALRAAYHALLPVRCAPTPIWLHVML